MKIKCGRHSNEFQLLGDDGEPLDIEVKRATVEFEPGKAVILNAEIYTKEFDCEVGEFLTVERTTKSEATLSKEFQILEVDDAKGLEFALQCTPTVGVAYRVRGQVLHNNQTYAFYKDVPAGPNAKTLVNAAVQFVAYKLWVKVHKVESPDTPVPDAPWIDQLSVDIEGEDHD